LLVQAVLVIASTRLLGWMTSAAVGIELLIVIVLVIALVIALVFKDSGTVGNLTSRGVTAGDPSYFAIGGGLMAGMVMGLTTLVGFDSAANLAEEAKDPFRSVPRAIVSSVVAAGVLGLIFLVALTVAIRDIPGITASGSPVAAIIRDQLGTVPERLLLTGISFAMFGAGMVVMTACSRQVFAMARDSRFPAHGLMRRVNPRTQTPVAATILILVVGAVLMLALPGAALLQLVIGSTILPAIIYGSTVILYLAVRKRLEHKEGGFSLGRFELPVAISALIWIVVALFVLVTPGDSLVPNLIVVGLILAGGVYFAKMWIFDRAVLDTEPL
jgi:amino acid transporter